MLNWTAARRRCRRPPSRAPAQALQTLDLRGNEIGDAGATSIAPHLPQALQTLDLGYSAIGAAGATASAPHFSQALQKLDLGGNAIGAVGARAIAPHVPPRTAALNLGGNAVGCAQRGRPRGGQRRGRLCIAPPTRVTQRRCVACSTRAPTRASAYQPPPPRTRTCAARSLSASAAYPLALPVDVAMATSWNTRRRACAGAIHALAVSKDARQAVRARPAAGWARHAGDERRVWGMVFAYLIDGEHARRPLREGAEEGWELVYAD